MIRVGRFTVAGALRTELLLAVISFCMSRAPDLQRSTVRSVAAWAAGPSRRRGAAKQHSSSAADAAAQLIEQVPSWDTAQCCRSAIEFFVQIGQGCRWQPIASMVQLIFGRGQLVPQTVDLTLVGLDPIVQSRNLRE